MPKKKVIIICQKDATLEIFAEEFLEKHLDADINTLF